MKLQVTQHFRERARERLPGAHPDRFARAVMDAVLSGHESVTYMHRCLGRNADHSARHVRVFTPPMTEPFVVVFTDAQPGKMRFLTLYPEEDRRETE